MAESLAATEREIAATNIARHKPVPAQLWSSYTIKHKPDLFLTVIIYVL